MNWGIIATGTIAAKFARTVNDMRLENERLVAVGSRNEKRARDFAETYGIERSYGSYEALLMDPDVDAVYIATPNNMHYENMISCLAAGKNVLCEKPFTVRAEEAELLYRMADEKRCLLWKLFGFVFFHCMKNFAG